MWIFKIGKKRSPAKSFNDYFSFRFSDIPDESFTSSKELNNEGTELTIYRKTLGTKELGMFDTIEVIMNSESGKTIILRTTETNWVYWSRAKKLVDHIHLFLGDDDENKGKWDSEDMEQFESDRFWARYWLEETHNPKIMLSFCKAILDANALSAFELRMTIR
jgi:hypothetical protein